MLLKIICFTILSLELAFGHPTGAGESACVSMVPGHKGIHPQISASPVSISVSNNNVTQGETVTVTIRGLKDDYAFLGFMIQARAQTEDIQVVGTFQETKGMKIVNCTTLHPNAVASHSGRDPKKSVALSWEASTDYVGPVNFL